MARLFEQIYDESIPSEKNINFKKRMRLLFVPAIISSIIFAFIVIGEKRERDNKNKNMADLVELLNMDNGSVLTQKVKYETFKKTDPEDTSDVFFEVVNPGDSNYSKGDLLKYNHRFFKEQGIEGKKYCIIEKSQVDFHLKQKDVKESLLKRQ